MTNPLLLYSTNTRLAFEINERYYQQKHYVWCTRYFNNSATPLITYTNPPSSCPEDIYRSYLAETNREDLHAIQIPRNVTGLQKGVNAKFAEGVITDAQKTLILSIIEKAKGKNFRLFSPLLYIIPFAAVESMFEFVPIEDRANPLSDEYIIKDLPREFFDVVDLRGVLNV